MRTLKHCLHCLSVDRPKKTIGNKHVDTHSLPKWILSVTQHPTCFVIIKETTIFFPFTKTCWCSVHGQSCDVHSCVIVWGFCLVPTLFWNLWFYWMLVSLLPSCSFIHSRYIIYCWKIVFQCSTSNFSKFLFPFSCSGMSFCILLSFLMFLVEFLDCFALLAPLLH